MSNDAVSQPADLQSGDALDLFEGSIDPQTPNETTPSRAPKEDAPTEVIPAAPVAPATPQGPPPAVFDAASAKVLAAALKEAGIATGTQPQRSQTQYTQDDYDKAFKVAKVSEADIAALQEGGPGAVAAMNKIVQAAVEQAVTFAEFKRQLSEESFNEKLSPLENYHQQQAEKAIADEFYGAKPFLKPFDSVIRMEVERLKGLNYHFPDKETAFAHFENHVLNVVKPTGVDIRATQVAPSPSATARDARGPYNQPASGRKMATVSTGGQPGASSNGTPGGGQKKNNADAMSIFANGR